MTNPLDLTTLANVKQYLGLTSADFDDLLARMITACSTAISSYINRQLLSASYSEHRDGTGSGVMIVADYPLISVQSLSINGNSINASSGYGQTGYSFDDISIYLTNMCFTKGRRNVSVVYTAGFASVPGDIEETIIEQIALRFKEKDRIGQASKTLAGETVAFYLKDFSPLGLTILDQYKKYIPV